MNENIEREIVGSIERKQLAEALNRVFELQMVLERIGEVLENGKLTEETRAHALRLVEKHL
jgi:coenzyme F420-reducing hydrogenase alpha subunit